MLARGLGNMDFEPSSLGSQRATTTLPFHRYQNQQQLEKPERDWKRTVLIVGLGALSWVATYVGMLELIEANMGDLPIIHKLIIGFSVAMLMTMIIWLLDQMFRPHPFSTKVAYAAGYIFLSLISVGFGFGFYWKVLESRGEASRSAESAVSQVQNSLHAASTRLEQLQSTLVQLTQLSTDKAELERAKGTSCPDSKPGDGPRRKMRDEDAQRFTFASEFVKGRVTAVKGDLAALDGDLVKIVSADASTIDAKTGNRNEFMRALSRKLDLTVTGFNAFRTDPQLRQIRTDLADRAERTTIANGGKNLSCPDPQLQTALRGVVKAIDQLPEMTKPEIAAVEGSEATIEAFRRLTTTFYGALAFKLPPSADELRELQKKAVQSVEGATSAGGPGPNTASVRAIATEQGGLSKRDYVPLAVAVFVDICLLLVSMVQRPTSRLTGLLPKMQAAERGPVIQILSRFNDIHRDSQIRENFEIFRHVVFDMHGDYYVAVPLDAPPRLDPQQREDLRIEAQLLANLFASFEKEKIFKRTMLPTTGSIQKRLARQGSKFAQSNAFRVYKFADGAWSDIILGAVMGGARRSEEERRYAEQTTDTTLPWPPKPTPPLRKVEPEHPRTPPASIMNFTRRATRACEPSLAGTRSSPAKSRAIDPEHASRFGPYAEVYQPSQTAPRHDELTVHAANSNTAGHTPEKSDASKSEISSVVQLPRTDNQHGTTTSETEQRPDRDGDAHTHVTLRRETATFSLPVIEASRPDELKSTIQRLTGLTNNPANVDRSTTLVTADRDNTIFTSSSHEPLPYGEDTLTAREMALIGRMAPPAAE